jgi:RNA polymerase sigma-70 factor (ECF subfamily)
MTPDSETREAELVDRAKGGDVLAFEALYRSYAGRVYGLCIRLTSDRAEAEDCTQETFIAAWQKLPEFKGESRLMTWLHSIAYHKVLGRHRARERHGNHLKAIAAETSRPDFDQHRDLEDAVSRLPDRAREALVLQKIYGYTHAESAAIMGITTGACKAQVHRAIQLLAAALPTDADDDGSVTAGGESR